MSKTYNTQTNIEKLREAFSKQNVDGGGGRNWWSPQWENNNIRVLPGVEEGSLFYIETARHNINGEWYTCQKYKKDPETGKASRCPICEARQKLFRTNDPDLIKIAKKIKAKQRFLMNIIDRKDKDDPVVYIYGAGIKVFSKIVSEMIDDGIDITDVKDGYDFVVKKEQGPMTENGQFPSYDNSKAKRKSTPLAEDNNTMKKILDSRYNLEECVVFNEVEELEAAIDGYLNSIRNADSSSFYAESESAPQSKPKQQKEKIKDFAADLKKQIEGIDDDDDDDDDDDF